MRPFSRCQGAGESPKNANHGYFFRILKSQTEAGGSKFAARKVWSSNYVHPKVWSEWIQLKAILASFCRPVVFGEVKELCVLQLRDDDEILGLKPFVISEDSFDPFTIK